MPSFLVKSVAKPKRWKEDLSFGKTQMHTWIVAKLLATAMGEFV